MKKLLYLILLLIFIYTPAYGVTVVKPEPSSSGGSGAVDSVFGRTNAVTAAAGDYETSEVTESTDKNYVTDADLISIAAITDPENAFIISPSGGDYTEIQAALTANPTANTLFIVYLGTYTNDTIHFTANNQYVMGINVAPKLALVTNTTNICNYGAYTGCVVKDIKMVMTVAGETAISTVDGLSGGSCNFKFCHIECVSSGNNDFVNSGSKCIQGHGTVKVVEGSIIYTNSATRGSRGKKAILIEDNSTLTIDDVTITATGSGTSSAFACIRDNSDSGALLIDKCTVTVDDDTTTTTYGLNIDEGAGTPEVSFNNIHVTNSTGDVTVIRVGSSSSLSVRSMYNHFHAVCGAGKKAYVLEIDDANTIAISQFDDIIGADGVLNSGGTYTYCNSATDGTFQTSGAVTGSNLTGTSSGDNTGDNSANTSTYSPGGTDVALADGGTGESLADPGADRILFWDDSEGTLTWLIPGTGLAISATTLNVSITSLDIALLENYILSGNGSNLAAGVAVSGDVTNADGVFTIGTDKIDPAMISTDAVTPDAIDKDGAFTGLTGNWKTTGSLSGQAEFTTDAAGDITITVNAVNYGTDANLGHDADIPDGACDAAADVGNWVVLISSLKDQYSLTSDDATNIFILADNETLTAGDELDVDGSMVSVMCIAAEYWKVIGYIDVAPTDGGPAD